MPLLEVRVHLQCDDCGCPFTVTIDPARVVPAGGTAHDLACDAVRGGLVYQGPGVSGSTPSVGEDATVYCGPCTVLRDQLSSV